MTDQPEMDLPPGDTNNPPDLPAQATQASLMVTQAGLKMDRMDELLEFSKYVAESPFAPKGMQRPGDVLVAIQAGMEIGLAPMQSLQSIAVINGRPGIYGDTALALVRASGLLESYAEEQGGKDDNMGCKITLKRKGFAEATEYFTVSDAKIAGLWNKPGPWTQYPKRMLKFRARGFALRDHFGDVLKGFRTVEELRDFPAGEELDARPPTLKGGAK